MKLFIKLSFISAFVLFIFLVPVAKAAGLFVVSNQDMMGWIGNNHDATNNTDGAPQTTSHSFGEFAYGPGTPPQGTGSVHYAMGTNGNDYITIKTSRYNGMMLSDINELSYWTYVTANNANRAPYLQLFVDLDNNGTTDETLLFEPVYQNGTYNGDTIENQCLNNPSCVTVNSWQYWDADQGAWWTVSDGTYGPPVITLTNFATGHSGAKLATDTDALRITTGQNQDEWHDFQGYADKLTLNGDIWDFEPDSYQTNNNTIVGPPTDKEQCKNNGWTRFNNPVFKNQGNCVSFVQTR